MISSQLSLYPTDDTVVLFVCLFHIRMLQRHKADLPKINLKAFQN